MNQPVARSRHYYRHIASAFMALAVFMSLHLAVASTAQAENFCSNAWLDRYGQSNDFCASTSWHYNYNVAVQSYEHSACVSTTTNSNKTGVNLTWACTSGPYNLQSRQANWGVLTHGIIRNNTTGDTNHASGSQVYCLTKSCEEG